VDTKCIKAHNFVCHSTLIPLDAFKLLFTIAEKLVCKCGRCFCVLGVRRNVFRGTKYFRKGKI